MVHSLGIHFGVSEWQQDFKKKLEFIESLDEEQEEVIDGIGEEIEVNKLENLNDQVEKVVKFYLYWSNIAILGHFVR